MGFRAWIGEGREEWGEAVARRADDIDVSAPFSFAFRHGEGEEG